MGSLEQRALVLKRTKFRHGDAAANVRNTVTNNQLADMHRKYEDGLS
jgi:hypothetical protein